MVIVICIVHGTSSVWVSGGKTMKEYVKSARREMSTAGHSFLPRLYRPETYSHDLTFALLIQLLVTVRTTFLPICHSRHKLLTQTKTLVSFPAWHRQALSRSVHLSMSPDG